MKVSIISYNFTANLGGIGFSFSFFQMMKSAKDGSMVVDVAQQVGKYADSFVGPTTPLTVPSTKKVNLSLVRCI